MRIYVEKTTRCWINGKEYLVEQGIQDVPDEVAEVLIYAKQAKAVEEQKKEDKKKK